MHKFLRNGLSGLLGLTSFIAGSMHSLESLAQSSPLISETRANNGNLRLKIDNLDSDRAYGVISNQGLESSDLFNSPVRIESAFIPSGTTYYAEVPMNSQNKFIRVLDLDSYIGPIPNINNLSEGQIIDKETDIRLSGFGDIFPFKTDIHVVHSSGRQYFLGTLDSNPPTITINPAIYPNGQATLYFVSTTKTGVPIGDTGAVFHYQTVQSRNVAFDSKIINLNSRDIESAQGYTDFEFISRGEFENSNYTFEVFDEENNLLSSSNGNFSNGYAYTGWDSTSNGVPIDTLGKSFIFNLTASPSNYEISANTESSTNNAMKITFCRTLNGYPILGNKLFTSEEWPSRAIWQNTRDSQRVISDQTYYTVLFNDLPATRYPFDYWNNKTRLVMRSTQTNDVEIIKSALSDTNYVGGWIWQGHGDPSSIVADANGFITADIKAREVSELRKCQSSNIFIKDESGKIKQRGKRLLLLRPLYETWNMSCYSAYDPDWAIACGTAPVDYLANTSLAPSFYFGFADFSYAGNILDSFTATANNVWVMDIEYPVIEAVNWALSTHPTVINWKPKAMGHPFCTFKGR